MPEYIRHQGQWKPVAGEYVRRNGVWTPETAGYVQHDGTWRAVTTGGPPPPPPPPGGIPAGGRYGFADTINGVTYDRTGPIEDLSSQGIRTTVYNAQNAFNTGQRWYAGLESQADLTTWKVGEGAPAQTERRPITNIGGGHNLSWLGGRGRPDYLIPGKTPWENQNPDPTGQNRWIQGQGPEYHGPIAWLAGGESGHGLLIEGFGCDNTGDGVGLREEGPEHGRDDWYLRGSALCGCRDDGVENDNKYEGLVDDCFISAMHPLAARPAKDSGAERTWDSSGKLMTARRTVLWVQGHRFPDLKPFGGNYGDPLVFGCLKEAAVNANRGIRFGLQETIWRWDGEPRRDSLGSGPPMTGSDAAAILVSTNNLFVFPYHTSLPAGWPNLPGFQYLFFNQARDFWISYVTDWMQRHPGILIGDPGFSFT